MPFRDPIAKGKAVQAHRADVLGLEDASGLVIIDEAPIAAGIDELQMRLADGFENLFGRDALQKLELPSTSDLRPASVVAECPHLLHSRNIFDLFECAIFRALPPSCPKPKQAAAAMSNFGGRSRFCRRGCSFLHYAMLAVKLIFRNEWDFACDLLESGVSGAVHHNWRRWRNVNREKSLEQCKLGCCRVAR